MWSRAPTWLKLSINWMLRPFGVRRPMIGILPFLTKEQAQGRAGEMTFGIFTHAPRHASDKPSYTIDSPGIVKWWDEQGTVGGYALIEVDKLLSIIRYEPGNDELKLKLLRMEEPQMVRVDRLD